MVAFAEWNSFSRGRQPSGEWLFPADLLHSGTGQHHDGRNRQLRKDSTDAFESTHELEFKQHLAARGVALALVVRAVGIAALADVGLRAGAHAIAGALTEDAVCFFVGVHIPGMTAA